MAQHYHCTASEWYQMLDLKCRYQMVAIHSTGSGKGSCVAFSVNFGVKRLTRLKLALEMYITLAPKYYVYCFSVES